VDQVDVATAANAGELRATTWEITLRDLLKHVQSIEKRPVQGSEPPQPLSSSLLQVHLLAPHRHVAINSREEANMGFLSRTVKCCFDGALKVGMYDGHFMAQVVGPSFLVTLMRC